MTLSRALGCRNRHLWAHRFFITNTTTPITYKKNSVPWGTYNCTPRHAFIDHDRNIENNRILVEPELAMLGRTIKKPSREFLKGFWWEQRESNPRPSACKADALNQLSYAPDLFLQLLKELTVSFGIAKVSKFYESANLFFHFVEMGGLEPPSKHRTRQLSTRLVQLWFSTSSCRRTGHLRLIL